MNTIIISKYLGRLGDWIVTATGGRWYLTEPHPDDVRIEDIAHALSHVCRFGGHCREFYSVAEHSVHVLHLLQRTYPEDYLLHMHGLIHDASEAFIGDVVRPLKITMPDYQQLEAKTMEVILGALGIPPLSHEQEVKLKHADNVMLMTERRDLITHGGDEWTTTEEPDKEIDVFNPWSPLAARIEFLDEYYTLREENRLTPT